jgi:hypothetical protein
MLKPIRILLQTTVPSTNDDWGIDRLSMLRDYLVSLKDDAGNPACDVVARVGGASLKENRQLNGKSPGRVIAQSTFHHFADYNWNVANGCPSFVTEPEGDGMQTEPSALADIHAYVRNLVTWLAPVPVGVASPLENRVIVEANRNDNLPSEIIPNARLQTLDRVGTFK